MSTQTIPTVAEQLQSLLERMDVIWEFGRDLNEELGNQEMNANDAGDESYAAFAQIRVLNGQFESLLGCVETLTRIVADHLQEEPA